MDTHRQRLMSAARRLLASHADAEDAVQDAYLRAFSASLSWAAPQSAWLHTVLRNTAIDRLRRNQLMAAHANVEAPSEASCESLFELTSETDAAVRHLLSHVSPFEAVAILLRDVFEFDYDEIARIIGKSESASRQLLHRARTRASRTGLPADAEEHHIALCRRAIESRDAAPLMELLQTITEGGRVTFASVRQQHGSRSTSMLVHVNGRYAIALVQDGIVLCIVPVGHQATFARDLA